MKKCFILLIALFLFGCGWFPQTVSIDDPRVQPLIEAASSFDRAAYGFMPLPQTGTVRLELAQGRTYDVMLHVDGHASRTISFNKIDKGYRWTGEQEMFSGPHKYTTVDGTFYEEITLTYEIEHVSGYPLNKLNISYSGEDNRFENRNNLLLEDVRPVLKAWGY
jgi:hypothetical protein